MNELKKNKEIGRLELISFEKNVSKSLIINVHNGTQLNRIKNREGNEATVAIIAGIIKFINDQLNIPNKMNKNQILNAAIALLEEYWGYNIEELIYFSKGVLTGKYGKIYQSFDQSVLFDLLHEYDMQRADAIELEHKNRKTQSVAECKELSPELKEILKEAINKNNKTEKCLAEKLKDKDYLAFKAQEITRSLLKKGSENKD